MPPTCHTCQRTRVCPTEGRFATGDWPSDANLPPAAHGKWYCSHWCYTRALKPQAPPREALAPAPQ